MILLAASKALKALEPLKQRQDQQLSSASGRVTFFCLKQQKSAWIPFGQKVTKEKCFVVNQEPASAEQTQAFATRDIHVPVAHGVHPAHRPSGVRLLTRVRSFAALGELRGLRLKPNQAKIEAEAEVGDRKRERDTDTGRPQPRTGHSQPKASPKQKRPAFAGLSRDRWSSERLTAPPPQTASSPRP